MTTWIWLAIGVALIASETVVPGLVAVFFGLAALIVAAGSGLGLIEGLIPTLATWSVSSIVLVFGLRGAAKKFLPAESKRESTNEELRDFGSEVEVIEACDDDGMVGRIRFQGTTWPARCLDGQVGAGEMARIAYRDKDGLGWVVEKIEPV